LKKQNEIDKIILEQKILRILDLWDRRVDWWNTDFGDDSWKPEQIHCMSNQFLKNLNADDPLNPVSWKIKMDSKLREKDILLSQQQQRERDKSYQLKREQENQILEKQKNFLEIQKKQKMLEHERKIWIEKVQLQREEFKKKNLQIEN